MELNRFEEVEFLYEDMWLTGTVIYSLEFDEYKSYAIESYGEEFLINEKNIRRLDIK
ncbi:MAG: hypothetical protein ACRC18_06735 [Cetobacterium sp.]